MIKGLIDKVELKSLDKALLEDPKLANTEIAFGPFNKHKVHPLHYLSDGVFEKRYPDEKAREMAEILINHGAWVDGFPLELKKDTPLIAAASLHADLVALLLISKAAYLHHRGCHGATALHWAAWTGADRVVKELILKGAELEWKDLEFASTPFFWAVHGYKNASNKRNQIQCAMLLLKAGVSYEETNLENSTAMELLDPVVDKELIDIISSFE